MCSLEVRGLHFELAVHDSPAFRCSEKMKMRERRPCGPVRRCRPTSRRMDRSWMDSQMDDFGVEDKRKRRFYSRADGGNDLRIRALGRIDGWRNDPPKADSP